MALHRGIQSAIFYYVSCAPCADVKYRKQRKKEAQWDRQNREALELEQPDLYRHPSPSSTNPYWQAEIVEGPTGTRKKRANMTESQTRLKAVSTLSSNGSLLHSSLEINTVAIKHVKYERDTPPMRYQREDEDLWGLDAPDPVASSNLSASAITRPSTARTAASQRSYQSQKHPALNDLHPSTTRKINAREEVAWMLQPPPVPDVMKGKMRPPRSRSDSGGSRPSAAHSQPISRQVSQRVVQERVISGPSSINSVLQEQFEKAVPEAVVAPRGHRRQRSKTVGDGPKSISTESLATRRSVSGAPMMHFTYSDNSQKSGTTIGKNSFLSPDEANNIHVSQAGMHKVVLRPTLSPIASDNATSTVENITSSKLPLPFRSIFEEKRAGADKSHGHQQKRQKPPLYVNDSSLGALESCDSPSAGKSLAPSPTLIEANQKLPTPNQKEEKQLEEEYPEMFDSWYTPDFDLSTWVTEHTKREVRHRWSMDI